MKIIFVLPIHSASTTLANNGDHMLMKMIYAITHPHKANQLIQFDLILPFTIYYLYDGSHSHPR